MQNNNLLGKYHLLELIYEGGMGKIYLAHPENTPKNRVIIKKLKEEFIYDKAFIHLLQSEVNTLKQLSHPNIVNIYEFISEVENHYAVLEYIDGLDLRSIFDVGKPENKLLAPEMALGIASQIAEGLSYIHTAKGKDGKSLEIIHSDLNPRNILINKEGIVKIIDFSIAQTVENKVGFTEGVGRGVISHMSPEQAEGKAIDIRSDIFAWGILLYQMLMGEIPFPGKNRFEVFCNLLDKKISSQDLPACLPEGIKKILTRSLEKNPEDRYQSMEELKKDLASCLAKLSPPFSKAKLGKMIQELKKI